MNFTPTIPTINQTRGFPPQTRTYLFVHSKPDGSGFEYYGIYGHQQKVGKKCIAPQERWHKTHLQLVKTAQKTRGKKNPEARIPEPVVKGF